MHHHVERRIARKETLTLYKGKKYRTGCKEMKRKERADLVRHDFATFLPSCVRKDQLSSALKKMEIPSTFFFLFLLLTYVQQDTYTYRIHEKRRAKE